MAVVIIEQPYQYLVVAGKIGPRFHRNDRLAEQGQATEFDRIADVADQVDVIEALDDRDIGGLVHLDAATAAVLGCIAGHLRSGHRPPLRAECALVGDGADADADRGAVTAVALAEFQQAEPRGDPLAELGGRVQVTCGQQRRKAIAANPGHPVAGELAAQDVRKAGQHPVAGVTSQGVVGDIQPVDVEVHHRCRRFIGGRGLPGTGGKLTLEHGPGRQPGQAVVGMVQHRADVGGNETADAHPPAAAELGVMPARQQQDAGRQVTGAADDRHAGIRIFDGPGLARGTVELIQHGLHDSLAVDQHDILVRHEDRRGPYLQQLLAEFQDLVQRGIAVPRAIDRLLDFMQQAFLGGLDLQLPIALDEAHAQAELAFKRADRGLERSGTVIGGQRCAVSVHQGHQHAEDPGLLVAQRQQVGHGALDRHSGRHGVVVLADGVERRIECGIEDNRRLGRFAPKDAPVATVAADATQAGQQRAQQRGIVAVDLPLVAVRARLGHAIHHIR